MKYVSLTEFCKPKGGKAKAASITGFTPHAIKKMLVAGRNITLAFDDADQFVTVIEHKTIESKKTEAA